MESLESIRKAARKQLDAIEDVAGLGKFEIEFFGRKQGKLTSILRSLSRLSDREKRKLGSEANKLRSEIQGWLDEKRAFLEKQTNDSRLRGDKIDTSLPGVRPERGHIHPLTHIRMEAERIFLSLGFAIAEGPQVETEFYNFDALNIPKDHPSRDLWDTFWLKEKPYLLRTHTSPVQIRFMEKHNPPFRIIAPGKVFRHEATDASHDFEFWQIEGLMVGKDISVANLTYVLQIFMQKLFGKNVAIRLRPSYFPFVEPGFEVDITCLTCRGKGCSLCKRSGWLEILGAGMVHQKVFEAAGYVPGEWQGFAFGVGLDRLALMKYKIPDIRFFRQNDIRFLKQF